MAWRGIDFFPHGFRFPFTRYMWPAVFVSLALNLAALGLAYTSGINFSIDFTGGTLIEVADKSGKAFDIGALRDQLGRLGIGSPQVQSLGDGSSMLIRLPQQGSDAADQAAAAKVREALGNNLEYRRTEAVGPTVSGEITRTALWAVLAGIVAISLYVWFRFEWQFALGAALALVHDILMTIGMFALTGLEFDNNCIAALLTIIGYSINDTVVVSDRIRENLRKYKKMPLAELMDLSISETLSRTVLTAGSVIVALLALLIFGGDVIRSLVVAMLFGIVIGTYSSIYIAPVFLMYFGVRRDWSTGAKDKSLTAKA